MSNSIKTCFFVVGCCGGNHMVNPTIMEESNEVFCDKCNKVIAIKGSEDNEWYYVGNKVFP